MEELNEKFNHKLIDVKMVVFTGSDAARISQRLTSPRHVRSANVLLLFTLLHRFDAFVPVAVLKYTGVALQRKH